MTANSGQIGTPGSLVDVGIVVEWAISSSSP
jgi:hypothetical protein